MQRTERSDLAPEKYDRGHGVRVHAGEIDIHEIDIQEYADLKACVAQQSLQPIGRRQPVAARFDLPFAAAVSSQSFCGARTLKGYGRSSPAIRP